MVRAVARPLACDQVPGHSTWEVNNVGTRCCHIAPVLEQVAELHYPDLPPIPNFDFIWMQTEVPELWL